MSRKDSHSISSRADWVNTVGRSNVCEEITELLRSGNRALGLCSKGCRLVARAPKTVHHIPAIPKLSGLCPLPRSIRTNDSKYRLHLPEWIESVSYKLTSPIAQSLSLLQVLFVLSISGTLKCSSIKLTSILGMRMQGWIICQHPKRAAQYSASQAGGISSWLATLTRSIAGL